MSNIFMSLSLAVGKEVLLRKHLPGLIFTLTQQLKMSNRSEPMDINITQESISPLGTLIDTVTGLPNIPVTAFKSRSFCRHPELAAQCGTLTTRVVIISPLTDRFTSMKKLGSFG